MMQSKPHFVRYDLSLFQQYGFGLYAFDPADLSGQRSDFIRCAFQYQGNDAGSVHTWNPLSTNNDLGMSRKDIIDPSGLLAVMYAYDGSACSLLHQLVLRIRCLNL
jgi:hypothetical protein